jgi:hypothetical protein
MEIYYVIYILEYLVLNRNSIVKILGLKQIEY